MHFPRTAVHKKAIERFMLV